MRGSVASKAIFQFLHDICTVLGTVSRRERRFCRGDGAAHAATTICCRPPQTFTEPAMRLSLQCALAANSPGFTYEFFSQGE